jgi:long-chain acyl-CoA synthetase
MINEIMPLDEALRRRAGKTPRKTFIKFQGKKFSFRDIDRLADAYASFLRQHSVRSGDRVAILCHNCPLYVAAYFGIIRAGAIVLPLNNLLTHEELNLILNDAGARLCFFDADCSGTVEKLRKMGDRVFVSLTEAVATPPATSAFPKNDPNEVSTILYTSGTTGRPKGALLTHRNILTDALSAASTIDISPRDRFVVFLPLFHSFTYTVCVIIPVLYGMTISLLPSVRPFSRVVKSIILDRVTILVAIPTVYKILAEKKIPFFVKLLLNLRLCISGAAPLPVRVIHDFERVFKVPLREGYGLTEASPVVALNRMHQSKPGTVGLPLPGLEVKVVDDNGNPLSNGTPGELIVKGPIVMKGYLNRPDDTAKTLRDGWLFTGDIASLDDDGYVKIIDRKKDMIIVDGLNVYPYEVEEVLYRHPAVQDCAMIGVVYGDEEKELPIMYVVLKEGLRTTPRDLRDFLSGHVAHYKIPRRFIFTEELPRNATGKIMKKELRKLYVETELKPHGTG